MRCGSHDSCRRWAPALVIVALSLAGCAGSTPTVQPPGSSGALSGISSAWRLGGAPGSASIVGRSTQNLTRANARPLGGSIPKNLYVSDLVIPGGGILIFMNGTYDSLGSITSGTSASDGLWVDQHGNLYAANADGGNVTEYAPGATSPTCTYSGLADPVNVTTDKHGHVFAVDWNSGSKGAIVEYEQCKDNIVRRFDFRRFTAPAGAVVDDAGNIFVAYYRAKASSSQQGAFEEFRAGSKTPKKLGATVVFPGSVLLDKNANLIVADQGVSGQGNGAIDVIAPPYSSATPLRSGLAQPIHLALNKQETLLFANSFDFSNPTVWVMSYPAGTIETTLGTTNGLKFPLGVADSPN